MSKTDKWRNFKENMLFRNHVNNRDTIKQLKVLFLGVWGRLGLETKDFHYKISHYLSLAKVA